MKKAFKKEHLILVVAGAWAILTLLGLVWPDREFSENENRYLEQAPALSASALLNGHYQSKVETYINDQFPLRDTFVEVKAVSDLGMGRIKLGDIYVCDDALIRGFPFPDEAVTASNIDGINSFMANYSVPADVMLVPTAAYTEEWRLPASAQRYDQSKYIESVYSRLPKLGGVDICGPLSQHSREYIYYRTDHHWTTYGAYLAYAEYCRAIGLEPSAYRAENVSDSFNGTFYSESGVRFVTPDIIESFIPENDVSLEIFTGLDTKTHDSVYYDEFLQKKDKYSYFLGTNEFMVTLKSDCESGRKLLIFKDSYAHCLAPMLTDQFSEVTLVDLRYATKAVSETVDVASYDRVLFMLSTTVFSSQENTSKLF